jgi:hypothetical protein
MEKILLSLLKRERLKPVNDLSNKNRKKFRKMTICWKCGWDSQGSDYTYCGNCGAEKKIVCPNCNGFTKPEYRYCGNCGYDLDDSIYFSISEYKKYYGDPNENLNLLTNSFGGLKSSTYIVVVTESQINIPFRISPEIVTKTQNIIKDIDSDEAKSKKIFDFITKTINYGETQRGCSGYRDAIEVFSQKEGVCGEMAILYVSMGRLAGLVVNYVSVHKDCQGKDVRHACAGVRLNGKTVLVDLTYYTYDIRHIEYEILTDEEAISKFRGWDG